MSLALDKLNANTKEFNDDNIALYAWIVGGITGTVTGIAWGGGACDTSSKSSVSSGPSRGIISTAEVSILMATLTLTVQ